MANLKPSTPSRPVEGAGRHKRSQSSVLKSIVSPRKADNAASPAKVPASAPRLPDPPFMSNRQYSPLGEVNSNRGRSPTRRPTDGNDRASDKIHTTRGKARTATASENAYGRPAISPTKPAAKYARERGSPVKTKSSTSLASLLSKGKPVKNGPMGMDMRTKEKENQTPPGSSHGAPAPIWAEFSRREAETPQMTKVPLKAAHDMHTPQESGCSRSPAKRDFFFDEPQSHDKKAGARPTSWIERSESSNAAAGSPKKASEMPTLRPRSFIHASDMDVSALRDDSMSSGLSMDSSQPKSEGGPEDKKPSSGLTIAKRGSRVMAAVAAWNGKGKDGSKEESQLDTTDPVQVEGAFEKMLEARDIAHDVRDKMRKLDTAMKSNLIKQDETITPTTGDLVPWTPRSVSRPGTAKRSKTEDVLATDAAPEDEGKSTKKSRPRSLTFTLGGKNKDGDSSSPTKKQKSSRSSSHVRKKSVELTRSTSATSISSIASAAVPLPEDFIGYFRQTTQPQRVEIGRMQKLKQLLRNETVAWVNEFITLGGMDGLVNLLYRIMNIEWREEHEDNLLHHTLTCLKALLTTSLALARLDTLQDKLFPKLLSLLFSTGDEKKGPSEFVTRDVLMSLLFAYLSAAPTPARAATVLAHLRDPAPDVAAQPPGFIITMHRPRPYKRWCTEVTNVSKEVFWIFLHRLNVVARPEAHEVGEMDAKPFTEAHFPAPRRPVPAAPHVGGVEWDATNYLTTHLDLLNGLIACVSPLQTEDDSASDSSVIDLTRSAPSSPEQQHAARAARNALRRELRDSGFERVLGGALRTCKEKFYAALHAGLRTWVAAAEADGWDARMVREGPDAVDEAEGRSRSASPRKAKAGAEPAPRLNVPGLDIGRADDKWL